MTERIGCVSFVFDLYFRSASVFSLMPRCDLHVEPKRVELNSIEPIADEVEDSRDVVQGCADKVGYGGEGGALQGS